MTAWEPDDEAEVPAAALIADLDRAAGAACVGCGAGLCGHAVLCSVALGFRGAPRCLPCLAAGLRRPPAELAAQLTEYMQRRDCYRQAWDVASDREGVPRSPRPACVAVAPSAESAASAGPVSEIAAPTAEWDAGNLACGDLVMELRLRLRQLPPGAVIRVVALDPAAPLDLPAWCRLTGHPLLAADHPVYLIQRPGSRR